MAVNSTSKLPQKPDGAGNLVKYGREPESTINVSLSGRNYYAAATNSYTNNIDLDGVYTKSVSLNENNNLDTAIVLRTMPLSEYWSAIGYGNGSFVAASRGVSSGSSFAASSTDGITWNQRTMPSSIEWKKIAYGSGSFIALGNGPSFGQTSIAASSTDGITWTLRTLPASVEWNSVTYGNGSFVAVGGNPSSSAASSTNGITWTLRTMPASAVWETISYGGGLFVSLSGAYGSFGGYVAYSNDGITWSLITYNLFSQESFGTGNVLSYGNNKFVSPTASFVMSSSNGTTWSRTSLPASGGSGWKDIDFGNQNFVTMLSNTSYIARSTDGITWTLKTLPLSQPWAGIKYGNGSFVVIGGFPSSDAASSKIFLNENISYGIWEG